MVPLGGVVVHHIEDDLDAGSVQRLDHVAKLIQRGQRILARAVRVVRREERDGAVAPVVDVAGRAVLFVELIDGQQFNGGHTEVPQVGNLFNQSGVGAAMLGGHA